MVIITKSTEVNDFFNEVRKNELRGKTNAEILDQFESLCKNQNKTPEDYLKIGYLYGWVLVASEAVIAKKECDEYEGSICPALERGFDNFWKKIPAPLNSLLFAGVWIFIMLSWFWFSYSAVMKDGVVLSTILVLFLTGVFTSLGVLYLVMIARKEMPWQKS